MGFVLFCLSSTSLTIVFRVMAMRTSPIMPTALRISDHLDVGDGVMSPYPIVVKVMKEK